MDKPTIVYLQSIKRDGVNRVPGLADTMPTLTEAEIQKGWEKANAFMKYCPKCKCMWNTKVLTRCCPGNPKEIN